MRSRSVPGRDWRSEVFCHGSEVVLFSTGALGGVAFIKGGGRQRQDLKRHCMNMCSASPVAWVKARQCLQTLSNNPWK